MDKILKNNTFMGIVAIATLALVVIMFVRSNKEVESGDPTEKKEA